MKKDVLKVYSGKNLSIDDLLDKLDKAIFDQNILILSLEDAGVNGINNKIYERAIETNTTLKDAYKTIKSFKNYCTRIL